jgi:uncharacterized protein
MRLRPAIVLLLALADSASGCGGGRPGRTPAAQPAPSRARAVKFEPWTRASFDRAAREGKYLLVSVQTSWCHWCHVMNDVTFRDPEVVAVLERYFVVVRVDADARPDLAERYARWGWPATGLLTSDATPLLNLRGYREPRAFARVLSEIAAHGTQAALALGGAEMGGASNADSATGPADLRALHPSVLAELDASWDEAQGGWGTPQKYPRAAPVEHALLRAFTAREPGRRTRALRALDAYEALLDPVWGGLFQYSVHGDWKHPHYEKIHSLQASAIELYCTGYAATRDARYLSSARSIARYLLERLRRADGAFYANQDADVGRPGDAFHQRGGEFYALSAEARAQTRAPSIDQSVFANLNGQSIAAFAQLYGVTFDRSYLQTAVSAYDAIERTHRRGGGYAHGEATAERGDPVHAPGEATAERRGSADPRLYLADQLEMARGLLALHEVTGEPAYLARLRELLAFIAATFEDARGGGFYAHTPDPEAVGALALARKPIAQNARLARVLLWMARREGEPAWQEPAERALRAVGDRAALAREPSALGEYALALEDLQSPYVTVTIVGRPDDPRSQALLRAAFGAYAPNRRIRLAPPEDSHYPYPGKPVAYMCSPDACSLPVTDPHQLPEALLAAGNAVRKLASAQQSPSTPAI